MITAREYLLNKLVKEASYHAAEAYSSYNAAIALAGGMEKNASVLAGLGAISLNSLLSNPLLWLGSAITIGTGFGMRKLTRNKIQNDINNANMLAKQQSDYIKKLESGLVPASKQLTPLQIGGAAAAGAAIPVIAGKIHDYFSNRKKERQYE